MMMLERIVIVFTTLTMMKVTFIEMVTNNDMRYDNNDDNYLLARKSKNDVTKQRGRQ